MEETKRYKLKKDYDGKIIRLTLVKIKEYSKFTRYMVTKVDDDGNEIPLYPETFTPEQVEAFYESSICTETGEIIRRRQKWER